MKPKKSRRWKIKLIIFTILALLIVVPTSIFIVRNNYSVARILPISQRTKAKALWRSLDGGKLKKLEEEGKIHSFTLSDSNIVTIFSDGYTFNFIYNKQGGWNTLPMIEIRNSTGYIVTCSPFQTDFGDDEDDRGILSKAEVEELSKRGIELYNQFVNDYNDL